MFQSTPAPLELSLAVVGLQFANEEEGDRRAEAEQCKRGEPVDLVCEPDNSADPRAVAVFSARGVQIGYLTAERCGWIGGKLSAGEPCEAIFQDLHDTIAVIRARIGGGSPALPPERVQLLEEKQTAEDDFYPDAPAPDWGA